MNHLKSKLAKIAVVSTLLLAFATLSFAQVVSQSVTMTATGTATAQYEKAKGVSKHELVWTIAGTVSTCSVKVEQSVDNSVWTDLIAAQTCTSSGRAYISGSANYIRINLATLTGAGAALSFSYKGYDESIGVVEKLCQDNPSVAAVSIAAATTTQIVALGTNRTIYICSYEIIAVGVNNVTLEYGTGSTCGTGTTSIGGIYPLAAAGRIAGPGGAGTIKLAAGTALCILTSGTGQTGGYVTYVQI